MHETPAELRSLQALIDVSAERAGAHQASIITGERRLDAGDTVRYLQGSKHLVVATTTRDGQPRASAADGLFLHGSFWFSTSGQSFKARHLAVRPAVSVAHVRGDDIAFFVHGTARMLSGDDPAADPLKPLWREVYDGSCPDDWCDTPADARYVQVVASTFVTYCFDRARFEALTQEDSR